MKNRWLQLLLLSFFYTNANALQPSMEIIERFDDVRLVAFITEAQIQNYPSWQPLKEQPPLSINEAIQAIRQLARTNKETLSEDAIKEIELRQLPNHSNYWHYLIKLKNNTSNLQVYIVLMNGKVIPAIIEPESYK